MNFTYYHKTLPVPEVRRRSDARGWHALVFVAVWLYGQVARDWYVGFTLAVQVLPRLWGGPVIYARDGRCALSTLKHECVHAYQMDRDGTARWSWRYLTDADYRRRYEIEAYAQQFLDGATERGISDALFRLYRLGMPLMLIRGYVLAEIDLYKPVVFTDT
jgi:hypothetical protein